MKTTIDCVKIGISKILGGAGSGNFNHEGRPGEVGGSAAAEAEASRFDQGKGGLKFEYVPIENVRSTFITNRPINYSKIENIKRTIQSGKNLKPLIATSLKGQAGLAHIEDGHHRVLALQQLGVKKIPMYIVNPEIHNMNNPTGQNFSYMYKTSNIKVPTGYG